MVTLLGLFVAFSVANVDFCIGIEVGDIEGDDVSDNGDMHKNSKIC